MTSVWSERSLTRMLLELAIAALTILAMGYFMGARAQTTRRSPAKAQVVAASDAADEPLFSEYRGVRIGMSADEARQKLGEPADKSDQQDFYAVSDNETAQIFYDASLKVMAVSIHYQGEASGVPTPRSLFGVDVLPKEDGSVYRLVQYPKAGYWVAYSRTSDDPPLVTVSMQKIK